MSEQSGAASGVTLIQWAGKVSAGNWARVTLVKNWLQQGMTCFQKSKGFGGIFFIRPSVVNDKSKRTSKCITGNDNFSNTMRIVGTICLFTDELFVFLVPWSQRWLNNFWDTRNLDSCTWSTTQTQRKRTDSFLNANGSLCQTRQVWAEGKTK